MVSPNKITDNYLKKFPPMYHKDPPSIPSIYALMQKFEEASNI